MSNQEQPTQTQRLPLAYIMWLTARSKFIDELIKQNPDVEQQWEHFEQLEIANLKDQQQEMEKSRLQLEN